MKLYVCWTTATEIPLSGAHPCGVAYEALRGAGHDPEVVKAYGWEKLPNIFNQTRGRKEAREASGTDQVPVLVTDAGEAVYPSERIVDWARANPVSETPSSAAS